MHILGSNMTIFSLMFLYFFRNMRKSKWKIHLVDGRLRHLMSLLTPDCHLMDIYFGICGFDMNLYGFHMIPYGFYMISYGFIWFYMVLYDFVWLFLYDLYVFHMISYCFDMNLLQFYCNYCYNYYHYYHFFGGGASFFNWPVFLTINVCLDY